MVNQKMVGAALPLVLSVQSLVAPVNQPARPQIVPPRTLFLTLPSVRKGDLMLYAPSFDEPRRNWKRAGKGDMWHYIILIDAKESADN